MKMKKFLSLAMAIVMTFAMMVPMASASFSLKDGNGANDTYSDKKEQSLKMVALTSVPTIAVALPTIGASPFVLNPYGMSVKVSMNGTDMGAAQTGQVISPIFTITNNTNVKLAVDVKVSTTLGGTMTLKAASIGDATARAADTKNEAFVQVAFEQAATSTKDLTAWPTSGTYPITLKAGDVTVKNIAVMNAALNATSGQAEANYLHFMFSGDMANGCTTPWTAKDTITTNIAFTFTPNPQATAVSAS